MPRWLLWTAAAVVSWGVWAVLAKVIGDGLTGGESAVLSSIGMLPVILVLALSKDRSVQTGGRWAIVCGLAGGAVVGLGNVPYYDLFARGAAAATAVSFTAVYPVVTVALAALFLGEQVNRIQAIGLVLALVAIYLFNVSEEGGLVSGWLAYAILPLVMWGVGGFLQKLTTGKMSGRRAALLVLLGFVIANVVLAAFVPWPTAVPLRIWALVAALGFFLAFGNYAVVLAYSTGKASVITPLSGLYPLVSVPIAVLLLGETVAPRTALGIACAVAAVVALSLESGPSQPQASSPTADRDQATRL
jgi:drug/metabolite transporter (DMT)-like permease